MGSAPLKASFQLLRSSCDRVLGFILRTHKSYAKFSKRIGTTLRTPDLTDLGFELVGGRLLADGANPAAQFMYENSEGHRLTVYVRKATDIDDTSFRFSSENGNSAFYWIDREFAYALVAPIGREKLLSIAQRVYDELDRK